jgi:glycosyltransferase involved in cell wall biosynthesis
MIEISVVIPTFRRPGLLAQAIDSVLAQEGVSIELIVVDDSPEGSARTAIERCLPHDAQRVVYLQCATPSGGRPAAVRNAGWPRARGRFVHFLDDDDRVAAGFYRAAVDAFQAHPDRGVVFGRIEPFADQESPRMNHERHFFAVASRRARLAAFMRSRLWMVANLLFKETLLVNSACLIRRECIEALRGYDTALPMNEDVDFFCRAIRRFGFRFLDQVALHYRIVPDSLMHGRVSNDDLVRSYRRMYASYRAAHGTTELLALKLLAHTVLRAA